MIDFYHTAILVHVLISYAIEHTVLNKALLLHSQVRWLLQEKQFLWLGCKLKETHFTWDSTRQTMIIDLYVWQTNSGKIMVGIKMWF